MANWDKDTVANALKVYYSKQNIADACYMQKHLIAVNPSAIGIKHKKVSGSSFAAAIKYGESGGIATTVANANTYAKEAETEQWLITPSRLYKADNIGTDLLYMADGDVNGAFFKAATYCIDEARNTLAVEFEKSLFRASSILATVDSATGTAITLQNRADARNIHVGMTISNAAGSETEVITGVNRQTGVLTVADSTGFTVEGTAIYRAGVVAPGFHGFAAHFPKASARTGSTDVHGVDQSEDWERLAGVAIDASDETPYEALINAYTQSMAMGGTASVAIMSHENMASFLNDAQSQRLFSGTQATLGFSGAEVAVPGGTLKVVASPFIANDVIYGVDPSDISLVHWGPKLINTLDTDGSILHWTSDADTWGVRSLILADMLVRTPVKHFVVEL